MYRSRSGRARRCASPDAPQAPRVAHARSPAPQRDRAPRDAADRQRAWRSLCASMRMRSGTPAAAAASMSSILSPIRADLREIEIQVGGRLQDHPRLGLAPFVIDPIGADPMGRMVGAMIDAGDRRLLGAEALAHPVGQASIGGLVEIAAADARLVGDDDQRPAQFVHGKARQLENARQELEILDAADIALVEIDHAVAVEEQRGRVRLQGPPLIARTAPPRWRARPGRRRCARR